MDRQGLIDALRAVQFLHNFDNEHLMQIADAARDVVAQQVIDALPVQAALPAPAANHDDWDAILAPPVASERG